MNVLRGLVLGRSVYTHRSQASFSHSLVRLSKEKVFLIFLSLLLWKVTWGRKIFLVISHPSVLPSSYLHSILLSVTRCGSNPPIFLFFLHVSCFLNLYSLEIYPGIYCVQLAVQSVEGGSLGRFCSPAVHHDAVNILRTAGWTGQPKP